MRVLVVDDELPARQRIVDLLRKDPCVERVLEAENGIAAVDTIESERPDVVFLDVQMPELDGLGVIDAIGAANMPLTVFVTAYDQHAIRAFEANALDYLLKPFSDERYEATMTRIKSRLGTGNAHNLDQNIAALIPRTSRFDRLVVKSAGRTRFIRATDIDWIEASGVYVTLHVAGTEELYRASLQDLAEKLEPFGFVRVHRSALVNLDSILHLEPISHGEFEVVLKHGSRCRISRAFRARLEERLGQTL